MHRGIKVDRDVVGAGIGIQGRDGADTGTMIGPVHPDDVIAATGPDGDALGEISGRRISLVGDVSRGETANEAGRNQHGVGNRAIARDSRLIAHHEQVAAGASHDVKRAGDVIEVACQEIRAGGIRESGRRRDIHAVVTGMRGEVGDRSGALHVEDIGTRAEVDIEGIHPVVVDAGDALGRRDRAGERRYIEIESHGLAGQSSHEVDDELVTKTLGKAVAVAEQFPELVSNLVGSGIPAQGGSPLAIEAEPEAAGDRIHAEADGVVDRGEIGLHLQAGQRGPRQPAGVAIRVTAVIQIDGVRASAAINGQKAGEVREHAAGARGKGADVDRVVAGIAEDGGVTGNGADIDGVVAAAGINKGAPGYRALDRESVVTRAEPDGDTFHLCIAHTGGEDITLDRGLAHHAEAVDPVGEKRADRGPGGAGAVHDELVNLILLVHQEIWIVQGSQRARDLARQADARFQRGDTFTDATFHVKRPKEAGEIEDRIKGVHGRADDHSIAVQHGNLDSVGRATKVDGVGAQAADDPHRHSRRGAKHPDVVVAFRQIDDELLDPAKLHEQTGTIDPVLSHHDAVAELRADDHHGVEPAAAGDGHRCIDRVSDLIAASAGPNIGGTAIRVVMLGIFRRTGQGKRADDEHIVTVATVESQHRLIVIDDKSVFPGAAVDGERVAYAAAEPAPGGLQQIAGVKARADEIGAEDLTNLVGIAVVAAVDRRGGAVVINGEVVGAGDHVDGQAVGMEIVVDALVVGQLILAIGVRILQEHDVVLAQQEGVGARRAADLQMVGTGHAGIEDVDQGVPGAGQLDPVVVCTLVAIKMEHRADRVDTGHMGRIDRDAVIPVVAEDPSLTGNADNLHRIVARTGIEMRGAGVGAADGKAVIARTQADPQMGEVGVGNALTHTQARQGRAGQHTGVRDAITPIVNEELVGAGATVEREQPEDAVQRAAGRRGEAAHVHDIVPRTGVHRRGAGNRADVHRVVTVVGAQVRRTRMRALDRERVAAGAQRDIHRRQRPVGQRPRHAQAAQDRRGQRARVGRHVARVVHMQRAAVGVAVHRQVRPDGVHVAARVTGTRVGAHVNIVRPGPGIDRRFPRDRPHVDPVCSAAAVHRRRAHVRAHDRERVISGTESKAENVDPAVVDAAGHPEAGDLRAGHLAGLGAGVARAHVERIRAAPGDGEHSADAAKVAGERRCHAADVHRVGARPGADGRRRADGAHVEHVVAITTVQGQNRRGGGDGHGVVAGLGIDREAVRIAVKGEGVVAVAAVQNGGGRRAVDREGVVAVTGVDREVLDARVVHGLAATRDTGPADYKGVGPGGAVDDKRIGARRVGNVDRPRTGVEIDRVGVVAAGAREVGRAGPVSHRKGVGGRTAGERGDLDAGEGQRFHPGAGERGVGEVEIDVVARNHGVIAAGTVDLAGTGPAAQVKGVGRGVAVKFGRHDVVQRDADAALGDRTVGQGQAAGRICPDRAVAAGAVKGSGAGPRAGDTVIGIRQAGGLVDGVGRAVEDDPGDGLRHKGHDMAADSVALGIHRKGVAVSQVAVRENIVGKSGRGDGQVAVRMILDVARARAADVGAALGAIFDRGLAGAALHGGNAPAQEEAILTADRLADVDLDRRCDGRVDRNEVVEGLGVHHDDLGDVVVFLLGAERIDHDLVTDTAARARAGERVTLVVGTVE